MSCCDSCAQNLPCESDCDPHGHHHHEPHEHIGATAADDGTVVDGAEIDPLTGMDLSTWQLVESVALKYHDAASVGVNQDQALAAAAEALGLSNDLGQGAQIITGYVEGRARFEVYLDALATNFASEALFQGETLSPAGQAEAAFLVDGDGDLEEFSQYMQVRAAVDARLSMRCSSIDRSVCLGRSGDVRGELANELRAALVSQSLALPVYSPPPVADEAPLTPPVRDPFEDVYPERQHGEPQNQEREQNANPEPQQPETTPAPTPSPQEKDVSEELTLIVHDGTGPKGGALARLQTKFATFTGLGKSKAQIEEEKAKADAEKARQAEARRVQREVILAKQRAWKLWTNEGSTPGGAKVQLAVDVTYPTKFKNDDADMARLGSMERSSLVNGNRRRMATRSVNLRVTHRQWTKLERAYKAARSVNLNRFRSVLQKGAEGIGFTGLEVLAYGLGRLRFDRFNEAVLSNGNTSRKHNIAKGVRGSFEGNSCTTRKASGIKYVGKSCLTERAEEVRRFNSFSRPLGRSKSEEAIWMQAFEFGSSAGRAIIPPPTTRGHFNHVATGATNADDGEMYETEGVYSGQDEEGLTSKLKAWFGGADDEPLDDESFETDEQGVLDELDAAIEATAADDGYDGFDDDEGTVYYDDVEDPDDDIYGNDPNEAFYPTADDAADAAGAAAALTARDRKLAEDLAADKIKAKALVEACTSLDMSACAELAKRGAVRVKNAGERLLEADDPAAVAAEVAAKGKSSAEPGFLDQAEDWYEGKKKQVRAAADDILGTGEGSGPPAVQEPGFLARKLQEWIDDVERVLFIEPLAVLEDWHKDLQARWASIKQGLLNAMSYLDPRTWFGEDGPEVLPPTAADDAMVVAPNEVDEDEDDWNTAIIALAALAGVGLTVGAASSAYIAPHAIGAYRDVLTVLAENADDIITAAIPSRAVIDGASNALTAAFR